MSDKGALPHNRPAALAVAWTSGLGLTFVVFLLLASPHRVAYANPHIVTNTNDSGPGSLRQAIIDAGVGDTIVFSLPVNAIITLTAELTVTQPITIDGSTAANLTLSGNNATRVFSVTAPLTLISLTVTKGHVVDSGGAGFYTTEALTLTNVHVLSNTSLVLTSTFIDGGGLHHSGGTLTLINSVFASNAADGYGGGLYTEAGVVIISNSVFSNNNALGGGGLANRTSLITVFNSVFQSNIGNGCGGLYNGLGQSNGTIIMTSSLISDNRAISGFWYAGGLCSWGGYVSIVDSTIANNDGPIDFGGIYNRGPSSMDIISSTISGNHADGYGGGLANSGTMRIADSTISDNYVDGLYGNAAYGGGVYNGGVLTITNSTLVNNSADRSGGGLYNDAGTVFLANSTVTSNTTDTNLMNMGEGGGVFVLSGTVSVLNTLIANNQDRSAGTHHPDVSGAFIDLGHNLIGVSDGSSGFTLSTWVGTDLNPLNPHLRPVADYGGGTRTLALAPLSPALNSADPAACPASDQRGASRPQGSGCDIGAFESQPPDAAHDAAVTPANLPVTINVLVNDIDFDVQDVLSVTAAGSPLTGTAALSGTTQVVYTPAYPFTGIDIFSYVMSDGIFTDTAEVTVTVLPAVDFNWYFPLFTR